ncbi:MAG: hypothetical protein HON47_05035 [Candidatus Diapherotrites archaeon]|jgi:hypothetical protein|uniref:Uncharacterized protein n=1 Tax=Candidatus Iainarchaeum sp. TaxID=3101447 RepID=A0A8T5GFW5_9ARCH|nr:hypothetical protein [Candidatus Diapherotrites archaeon]
MAEFLLIIVVSFSLVLQISAAYLAYKIYRFNRLSPLWLIMLSAFELEVLRRMFVIFADITAVSVPATTMFSHTLMFAISLFLNIGLFGMMKNFETFEFVQKNVEDKAKKFKKKK